MSHSNDKKLDFRKVLQFINDGGSSRPKEDKEEFIRNLAWDMTLGLMFSSPLVSARIYRVPKELSNHNKSAYTPQLFPIGPLHINEKHLQSRLIQDVKNKYTFILLWRRNAFEHPGDDEAESRTRIGPILLRCYEAMEVSIQKAIDSYTEYVSDEVTPGRMLLDGCFILELLFRNYLHWSKDRGEHDGDGAFNMHDEDDPHIVNKLTRATVQHDLLVLGNQLPFFVLQALFKITLEKIQSPRGPRRSLEDYVLLYLGKKRSPEPVAKATNCWSSFCTTTKNCFFPCGEECVLSISDDTKAGGSPGDAKEEGGNGDTIEEGGPSYTKEEGPGDTKEESGPGDAKEGSPGDTKGEGGPSATKQEGSPGDTKKEDPEERYYHILHVIHDSFDPPDQGTDSRLLIMRCASELDYAGVKFVAGTGEDLFKVKFGKTPRRCCRRLHRAEFEIPKLKIDYTSEHFLRNLVAFEQCTPGVMNYFTSYVFLMGLLVNTEKDVQVLVKAGIIDNFLGTDQDAADLFNNLCKEVVVGKFHFAEEYNKAVKYSERCLPKNIAHIKRTYFASPWTFVAICVGFIAFGMGIAQFILGFL